VAHRGDERRALLGTISIHLWQTLSDGGRPYPPPRNPKGRRLGWEGAALGVLTYPQTLGLAGWALGPLAQAHGPLRVHLGGLASPLMGSPSGEGPNRWDAYIYELNNVY
jgi:hypothetical protein